MTSTTVGYSDRTVDVICVAVGLAFGILLAFGIVVLVHLGLWALGQNWPHGWSVQIFVGLVVFTFVIGALICFGLAVEGFRGVIKNRNETTELKMIKNPITGKLYPVQSRTKARWRVKGLWKTF